MSDAWMTVYCLKCRETWTGNGWGLAPETGTVICRQCRGILTKVIDPPDFVPVPLRDARASGPRLPDGSYRRTVRRNEPIRGVDFW